MANNLFKKSWLLIKQTFKSFSEDKVMKLGGSLAYYTIFSMGPLLVVIISLCGIFFKRDAIENKIYSVMQDFVGQDTAVQLQEIIRNAGIGNKGNIAAIVSIVVLIIGATSVFAEIQDSINGIWGLKAKPQKAWFILLRNRLLSFSVIISLGFLLLVSLTVTGIIEALNNRLKASFPDVTVVLFYVVNLIITLLVSTLIFAVIFKVLPDAKIKWKDVMIGAIVTALLFILGKFGISMYISQTKVGSTYGAAGSLVVFIVWVYYSSIILYLGAEFTKAYAVNFGSAIYPNEYAVTTQTVEIETGKKPVADKEISIQKNRN
ncbi:MAG: YihY/virulence factor BrkB family protein [Agriterribacter sp.]